MALQGIEDIDFEEIWIKFHNQIDVDYKKIGNFVRNNYNISADNRKPYNLVSKIVELLIDLGYINVDYDLHSCRVIWKTN